MPVAVHTTPPRQRRFGTLLSENSPEQTAHVNTSTKPLKDERTNSTNRTYTVSFAAGVRPLGLQLEPFCDRTACRVQGFVDAGPSQPGPARALQCITPGDVLTAVNGHAITSYDQAIALLKDARVTRQIVLQQPASAALPLSYPQPLVEDCEAPSTATKTHLPGTVRKMLRRNGGALPDEMTSPSFDSPPAVRTPSVPTKVPMPTREVEATSFSPAMDVSLILSADDLVLLSQPAAVVRPATRRRRPSLASPTMTTRGDDPQNDSQVLPVADMIAHDFCQHEHDDDNEAQSVHRLQRELQQAKETLADQSTYWKENTGSTTQPSLQWQEENTSLQQELVAWKERAETLERDKEQARAQSQELQQQLTQRQHLVDEARLQRDGAVHILEQKSALVDELSRKLEVERQQAASVQTKLQDEVRAVQTRAEETQVHFKKSQSSMQCLEATLRDKDARLVDEERLNQRLRNEVASLCQRQSDDPKDTVVASRETEGRLVQQIELYKAEVEGYKQSSVATEKELGKSRKLNADLLQQTERLQRAIEMSDQRCCDVETRLERQTTETETALQTIENLQQDAQKKNEELSSASRSSKMVEANVLVETRLATARLEMTELQRSLEEADSRNQLLVREKCEVAEASEIVQDKLSRTQDQLRHVQMELSEKDASRSSLEECLKDTTVELAQRSKELEASEQAVLSLESRFSTLRKESTFPVEDSPRDTLASDLIATQAELGDIKNRNTELERLLRSMRRSLTDSERRATTSREQVEAEKQTFKDFSERAKADEDEVQQRVESLSSEVRSLRNLLSTSEEERKQMERLAARLGQDYDSARIDMSTSLETRQDQLNKIQAERSSLVERLTSHKKEISDLSERLRVSKSEHESARREMSTLRRTHAGQIQTIKQECDAKVNTLSEVLKKKDQDLRLMNKCKDDLRIARDELARTEKSCQRSREECDLLSTLLDEVRDECTLKSDDLKEAHLSEMRRLVATKDEIQSQLDATRQQLDMTAQQLYAAEEATLLSSAEKEKLRTEKTDIAQKLQRTLDELSEKSTELDQARLAKETSFDESDDFSGMSRQDVQERCLDLATEIQGMRARLEESHGALAKRKEHNQILEERWAELSQETVLLANSNRQLEDRLVLGKESQEEAHNALSSERSNVKRLNEALNLTRSQLLKIKNEREDLTSNFKSLRDELDRTTCSTNQTVSDLKGKLATAKADLEESERLGVRSIKEAAASNIIVVELKERIEVLEKRLAEAEEGRDSLQAKYNELSEQNVDSMQEVGAMREEFVQKIADLESKCDHFQGAMTGLESDLDAKKAELNEGKEAEERLLDAVEEYRRENAILTFGKDEGHVALTEALQQGKSYKETIRSLEAQLLDSERETTLLSSQIETLRGTISKLEENSGMCMQLRSKQLQESEAMCLSLVSERDELVCETESLREEQRGSRRKLTEQDRMVASLEGRVGSLSDSLDRMRCECEKATLNEKTTSVANQALESDLDSKRMEIDNLKARIQVLEATISRMQSDRALLEDESCRAEQKVAASCDLEDELFRLQSKLHSQESKLVSLSKVHKSQQQVLSLSQSLEGQLISFVEDALHCAGDTIFELASQSLLIQEVHASLVDEKDPLVLDELNPRLGESISNLIDSIPRAKSILEEKHEQLETWKQRRSRRVPDISYSTPDSKAKTKPESPSVLLALDKMKDALNDELLSPHKAKRAGSQTVDAEYLSRVVRALESQIDGLLDDLQSANDALRAKDQLFADFEQLVAHHESERDILERKLAQAKQSLSALDANAKQQTKTADALAFELETTREKISILKKHLKKSRRGKGHRHSDLDSINEDNVAAEEGYQTT